ncbi:MAG: MarR family transcriptional regulator [Frankia sp.]|nr:MarR family transcriptional regulator [Frankia sp.]
MKRVKAPIPYPPDHVLLYMDHLNRRISDDVRRFVKQDRDVRLRASELRLLSLIPPGGARVTELAESARVTKQALGQFADALARAGHVTVTADPDDRRVRVVRRTSKGDDAVRTANDGIRAMERSWRRQLGPSKYDSFIGAIRELGETALRRGADGA